MNNLILVYLLGFSVFPSMFIKEGLNLWFAQMLWGQVGIIIMFAWRFKEKPIRETPKNIPLLSLLIWVAIQTALVEMPFLPKGNTLTISFLVPPLLQTWNLLLAVMFYRIVCDYMTTQAFDRIMVYLKWLVVGTILISILQYFNLIEFFHLYFPDDKYRNGRVFGMIGNGTHFSAFLGMMSPVFYYKFKKLNLLWIFLMLAVMTQTGNRMDDPSISGYIIFTVLLLTFIILKAGKVGWWWVIWTTVLLVIIFVAMPQDLRANFLSHNGRLNYWPYWWDVFRKGSPFIGKGLGFIGANAHKTPFPMGHHMHLEYFHFLIELGIVGFGLITWMVVDFINSFSQDKAVPFLIVLGFLINCLFLFPAHLWIVSSMAVFFYAIVRILF